MKKLYFLLLLITGMVNAQIVNIPDANFKAALITYGVDTNADGNIQVSEAQAVNVLVVSNSTITDLTGLENFTSLFSFDCSHNTITSLNVNGLSNLSDINCSYNQIFNVITTSYLV